MSTSVFPVNLDSYVNPTATSTTNSPSLAAGQTLQNDSLSALETAVGITNSTIPGSLTYQVNNLKTYAQTILTDTGTVNLCVITPVPAVTSYVSGQRFNFYPAAVNTGASTLNVSGLGTKVIQYGGSTIAAGYLAPTLLALVIYDGTNFQLINPATTVLGYSQITATFTTTLVSTAAAVTGLTTTVTVPANRRVKIDGYTPNIYSSQSANQTVAILIYQDGVQVGSFNANTVLTNNGQTGYGTAIVSPSAGSHTYSLYVQQSSAGTLNFIAVSNSPAFIAVTLI